MRDFPLFELGLVALPAELVPLHIFEPRYRAMLAHCLEHESEFGIVWRDDDGAREIGCACEVAEVLERFADGRTNLVARGTRPFRILERRDDLPFPAGTVEFLEDAEDELDPAELDAAHDAYAELYERATDRAPEATEIAAMGAYEMAATVDFGPEAKQSLLELRSEPARLRQCTRLFRAALKRLGVAEQVQARARSNGKVRF